MSKRSPSLSQVCKECGAICCKPLLYKQSFSLKLQVTDSLLFCQNGLSGLLALSEQLTIMPNVTIPILLVLQHIFGYCPFYNFEHQLCIIHHEPYYPFTCESFPYLNSPTPDLINGCLLFTRWSKKYYQIQANQIFQKARKFVMDEVKNLKPYLEQIRQLEPLLSYVGTPVTNTWGTFTIESYRDEPLDALFLLLDQYAKFQGFDKLYVRLRVISRDFKPIHLVTGIMYESQVLTPEQLQPIIQQKIDESYNHTDPALILGVVFEDELEHYPAYWQDCWRQRLSAWKQQ